MNQNCFLVLCCALLMRVGSPFAQEIDKETYRKEYHKNQLKIDRQFGGIGLEVSFPDFGDATQINQPWVGIDLLSDFFHFNYSVGRVLVAQERIEKTDPIVFSGTENTGRHLSLGGHFPLPVGIGRQSSFGRVFRLNPVLGFDMGVYKFWESQFEIGRVYYLSGNGGIRLRLPYLALEAGVRARLGIESTNYLNVYRGFGIDSYFSVRLDGLKLLLAPNVVSFKSATAQVTNVQSATTETTRYLGRGVYNTTTKTTTTYNVNVSSSTLGIQDIGPFFGIGPRIGFNNQKSSFHTDRGRLYGLSIQGRSGPVSVGLNFEGGRIGHASALKEKDDAFTRRIDKNESFAKGSNTVFNTFFDLGLDISDGLLAMTGTAVNREGVTSFFSVIAGYSFGFYTVGGHQYNADVNPWMIENYEAQIKNQNIDYKPHEIAGENARGGYLGGWFIAMDVGAVQTRFQWYKYYRAPLLNNLVVSLTYRLPLDKMIRR